MCWVGHQPVRGLSFVDVYKLDIVLTSWKAVWEFVFLECQQLPNLILQPSAEFFLSLSPFFVLSRTNLLKKIYGKFKKWRKGRKTPDKSLIKKQILLINENVQKRRYKVFQIKVVSHKIWYLPWEKTTCYLFPNQTSKLIAASAPPSWIQLFSPSGTW